MSDILSFILTFGSATPILLFCITLYVLSPMPTYLYIYVIGTIFNGIINLFLKQVIAEPRPHRSTYKPKFEGDIYGMPSGHSQFCAFTLLYVWCVLDDFNIFLLYFFISAISIWSRDYSEYHTKQQLFAGLLVGGMVGKVLYTCVKNKMVGGKTLFRNDFTFRKDHPFYEMVNRFYK